jgi:hypothetical protein
MDVWEGEGERDGDGDGWGLAGFSWGFKEARPAARGGKFTPLMAGGPPAGTCPLSVVFFPYIVGFYLG